MSTKKEARDSLSDHSVDLEDQGLVKKEYRQDNAGDGTNAEDQYLHGIKLLLCLVSMFLCMFLSALDQTIVATILTVIGNKFNSFDKIGWLTSGFFLSMAVLVATWGRLSIIFGRKGTLYISIVLFEAGSLMCALANDMNTLIGGRVLAGVGAGGLQSMAFVIISEVVPLNKRPLSMALMGCVFAVASVVGPLLGGAFTTHATWRWCFYINLPIGGVALAFLFWAFNPPRPQGSVREKLKLIDYVGTVLLCGGLVVFLLALTFGSSNQYPWNSGAVISCFVIGAVVFALFWVWNFRFAKNPTIPPPVVKVPQVAASSIAFFAAFAYFMCAILFVAIYFQEIHGQSAWKSGIHLLPVIIPVVVSSIMSGIIIRKTKMVKPLMVLGGVLAPIGCGLLSLLDVDSSSSRQIGLLIIVGISVGVFIQGCLMSAQIAAPNVPGGTIMTTVLANFSRSVGGTLGSILAQTVFSSSSRSKLTSSIAALKGQKLYEELKKIDIDKLLDSTDVLNQLSPEAKAFVKVQIMGAIRNVFYLSIGFAGIATIACVFSTNKKLPDSVFGADKPKDVNAEINEVESTAENNSVGDATKEMIGNESERSEEPRDEISKESA
ncbi:uncharacterized protein PRCAT00001386001 [Priceomyces carsonii]|uniref:uncharacterized protein n=1 Tax=Priceomyces carsonii TaxID=28549 RepID=UPI002EDAD984|nr:unnamed protein product [Priceomyces carsonii]